QKPSTELHPDEIVAMGAAIQGAILAAQEQNQSSLPIVRVRDVTSHSMGVVAVGDGDEPFNSIVLPRNTPYGTTVSEDGYRTMQDNQAVFLMRITEGEGDDLSYVRIIIQVEVRLPPYPKGAEL